MRPRSDASGHEFERYVATNRWSSRSQRLLARQPKPRNKRTVLSLEVQYQALLPSDALRLRVAWLGFRSALPLGALVAGLGLIYASNAQPHAWRSWLAPSLLSLIVTLPSGALIMVVFDPFDVRSLSSGSMTESACALYLLVWGLHTGAYAGIIIGLAIALVRARRQRQHRPATGA